MRSKKKIRRTIRQNDYKINTMQRSFDEDARQCEDAEEMIFYLNLVKFLEWFKGRIKNRPYSIEEMWAFAGRVEIQAREMC